MKPAAHGVFRCDHQISGSEKGTRPPDRAPYPGGSSGRWI